MATPNSILLAPSKKEEESWSVTSGARLLADDQDLHSGLADNQFCNIRGGLKTNSVTSGVGKKVYSDHFVGITAATLNAARIDRKFLVDETGRLGRSDF